MSHSWCSDSLNFFSINSNTCMRAGESNTLRQISLDTVENDMDLSNHRWLPMCGLYEVASHIARTSFEVFKKWARQFWCPLVVNMIDWVMGEVSERVPETSFPLSSGLRERSTEHMESHNMHMHGGWLRLTDVLDSIDRGVMSGLATVTGMSGGPKVLSIN